METFYCYMVLLGLCAFYVNASATNFKGSSGLIKMTLTTIAAIGFLSFFAIIVTSFFYITWWHSILILVITSTVAGSTNNIGKNPLVGIISAIGVFVFNYLTWSNML